MKKIFYAIALFGVMCFASCGEKTTPTTINVDTDSVVVTDSVADSLVVVDSVK